MMWRPRHLIALLLSCCLVKSLSNASILSHKQVVVVGGGPVGLYFSALLLHKDPTVKIQILEKSGREGTSFNAFGLGVGERMQNRLSDVPGLKERAISVSSMIPSLGIPLVSRNNLCEHMAGFLDTTFPQCKIWYQESCDHVDLESQTITAESGKTFHYDLLVAADGVNSSIRHQLVREKRFREEHYVEDSKWKALQLPKQPDMDAGSFKSLSHPSIAGGRVLPRSPEGHILLLFWRSGADNPKGVETAHDLKVVITEALQSQNKNSNLVGQFLGFRYGEQSVPDMQVVFDDDAVNDFIARKGGQSHHLKLEQYHYRDSVALLGDAAHSMNSLLGQGCALGLESAHTLVEALMVGGDTTLGSALTSYTDTARPEAHALTELSLISYAMRGKLRTKLLAVPLLLLNALRGKSVIQRVRDIRVPFQQLAAENRLLLKVCRRDFEKKRIPFVPKQKK